MNKLIDAALGIHPRALTVGAQRLEVLAENMANADTPGFKAREVDFRDALAGALEGRMRGLARTHAAHMSTPEQASGAPLKYRIPNHPALDGNTVDAQMEQTAFSEAAVRYQASLDFLSGRIDGLRKALRGE